MNFGRQDQDDEIIRLLGKLNDAAPEYPSSMFNKRRVAVMAAFAALNLGAATAGLGLIAHLVKIVKAMGVVEKVVLAVEVTAVTGLTAYGAVTAYVYRDEIRDMLQRTFVSTTATPFPSLSVPAAGGGATEVPGFGTPTATASPTPTGTYWTPTSGVNVPGDTPVPPTGIQATNPPATIAPPNATATSCGNAGKPCQWTPKPPHNTPKPTP